MKKHIILIFLLALAGCSTQSRVENYITEAREYSEQNDYIKALELLNKAIELAPNDTAALYSRYEAYNSLGNKQNAYNDIAKLVQMYPDTLDFNAKLAHILTWLNQAPKAIAILDSIIQKDSCEAGYFSNRGFAYFMLKDYSKSIIDYNHAIQLVPDYYIYYSLRASSNMMLKEYANAIEDLNKVIQLHPYESMNFESRGLSKMHLNDTKGAIDDLSMAISIDSNNLNYYITRGFIYRRINNSYKALADYNRALDLDSMNNKALFGRAIIKSKKGAYENAMKDLEKLYIRDTTYAPVISYIVMVKENLKDYDKMLYYAHKLVDIAPNDPDSYIWLGDAKFNILDNIEYINQDNSFKYAKQLNEIINDYSKAIEIDSTNAESYYERGFIKLLIKDESACSDCRRSIELGFDKTKMGKSIEIYCPDLFK